MCKKLISEIEFENFVALEMEAMAYFNRGPEEEMAARNMAEKVIRSQFKTKPCQNCCQHRKQKQ